MTKQEILELCLKMIWEQKRWKLLKWLLLAALVAFIASIAPEAAPYFIAFWSFVLIAILFIYVVRNYFGMKKDLYENIRTLWIEDGMIKQDMGRGHYSESSCNRITVIKRTRNLLMLGIYGDEKTIAWYPIPLRVFMNQQEVDRFVGAIKSLKAQDREKAVTSRDEGQGKLSEKDQNGQVYFSFSFHVGKEEQLRMRIDSREVCQSKMLRKPKKRHMIRKILKAMLLGYLCWILWQVLKAEWIAYIALFLAIFFMIWLLAQIKNPEEYIKKQARIEGAQNDCANWEISITEAGIWQSIQNGSGTTGNTVPWEDLYCMVETDVELLFFLKNDKGFIQLLKTATEGREQIENLKELCREKNLQILAGKRKKYAPRWICTMLEGLIIIVSLIAIFGGVIFRLTLLGFRMAWT